MNINVSIIIYTAFNTYCMLILTHCLRTDKNNLFSIAFNGLLNEKYAL